MLKSFFLLVLPLIVALLEYLTFFYKTKNRKQKTEQKKKTLSKKPIFVYENKKIIQH